MSEGRVWVWGRGLGDGGAVLGAPVGAARDGFDLWWCCVICCDVACGGLAPRVFGSWVGLHGVVH
jgi:hypothetical protein